MDLGEGRPQKSGQLELPFGRPGEAWGAERSGEPSSAMNGDARSGTERLMEEVVQPANLKAALRRVKHNKGAPGIDGMSVEELPGWLWANWQRLREELLAGRYQPSPVRRQTIPKPGGGERELGIPTVVDRFIQQAILQVLQPRFDPTFSDHSYGFRPSRRAHDAVRRAQQYVQEGMRWVVDVDLAKFFDRVNHDVLMGKLEARIGDKRMLGLIRRYLDAGVMVSGVVIERHEGTPQGGPLSPLLANVLLDEVDKELEKRGHAFVRYADDCNVYVRSRRAGERVLVGLRKQYARLRLQVNGAKSAVDLAVRRKFLGFSFWVAAEGRIKLRVAGKALGAMKAKVRELSNRNRGRSVPTVVADLAGYLSGWREYFRLADTPGVFRDLDKWIRHRLRCLQLKQWKRGRTVFRELRARGMSVVEAAQVTANTRRWWHNSALKLNFALPTSHFDRLGLPRLAP